MGKSGLSWLDTFELLAGSDATVWRGSFAPDTVDDQSTDLVIRAFSDNFIVLLTHRPVVDVVAYALSSELSADYGLFGDRYFVVLTVVDELDVIPI